MNAERESLCHCAETTHAAGACDKAKAPVSEGVLRAALIEAETRLQNCWNAGQTFGYVREQADLGLIEVRAALEALGAWN